MKKIQIILSALIIALTFTAGAQTKQKKRKKKYNASNSAASAAVTKNAADEKQKNAAKPGDDEYLNAIGLKALYGIAFTGKHFFTRTSAAEAIVNYRNYSGVGHEFNLSALYEYHNKIADVPGLRWYLGGGGFVGHYTYDPIYIDAYNTATSVGLTAVAGLEYKFNGIPLALSADWQPILLLNRNSGLAADNGGFGVKYTF